jgi:putative ABC transport system permease protein
VAARVTRQSRSGSLGGRYLQRNLLQRKPENARDWHSHGLGASDAGVASMVVRQGLLLALVGLGVGLLGAFAMARVFSGLPLEVRWLLLFDVHPTDPLILALASVMLTIVAMLACFLPARRAAKVDPIVALRCE